MRSRDDAQMKIDRRAFLRAASVAPAAALAGCEFSFEQGFVSQCGTSYGDATAAVVERAWEGLRHDRVWDTHVHLFGNGLGGEGVWAADGMNRPMWPEDRIRHFFYVNGGCVTGTNEQMNESVVARLRHLAGQLKSGAKLMLLAFAFTYGRNHEVQPPNTTFSVSNDYARRIAQRDELARSRFEWVASIHPLEPDAARKLREARAQGARAIKWLPPSMAVDLNDPATIAFAEEAGRIGMPLLIHLGEEKAVPGAGRHELANPWHARRILDETKARVIVAHCASLGKSENLEATKAGARGEQVTNFSIFEELMRRPRYEGRLFGDISAVTQLNRGKEILPALLEKSDWHARLLNGSDYPLPGIMPLFSLDRMVRQGILDPAVVPALRELRETNALLFDFVLKRNLSYKGARFAASVFETRGFFSRD